MPKKKKAVVPLTPEQVIVQKLNRVNELRVKINEARALYAEHDALVEAVLPLFITQTQTGWNISREFSIGGKTYTFSPSFYDTKKAKLVAKIWKSCAFESGRVA
jgi:hypothetical protein